MRDEYNEACAHAVWQATQGQQEHKDDGTTEENWEVLKTCITTAADEVLEGSNQNGLKIV